MKLILILLCLVFTGNLFAKDYAAGFILGTPTGLTGKYQKTDRNAFQLDLAEGYAALDYLWYDDRSFNIREISWFYGAGAVVFDGVGARGITGVEYNVKDSPFHLLANASYTIVSERDISHYLGIAVGARIDF